MKIKIGLSFIVITALISVPMLGEAQSKKTYRTSGPSGDVEYNATENSPTLPLVQSPPPQNSPNSVVVGAPSYYYYSYPPMGGGYGGGGYYGGGNYYGNTPQAGAAFYNVNGNTGRTFWATTPIPGQFSPYGGGFGGPGYGPGFGGPGYGQGYGGGYGPGFYPYGGNIGFTP